MWKADWRDQIWSQLDSTYDIIIIGGGITGAGILREAATAGFKVLLVEANDFASGTSSRSSKLVHGGLRYLKNFQFKTTLESVKERQELLTQGTGLINHLNILFASYLKDHTPAWKMSCGLVLYNALAGKLWQARLSASEIKKQIPFLNIQNLIAGFPYYDAQTDDARLTIRVLQEAVNSGGIALNYARASSLLRNQRGHVKGIVLTDKSPNNLGRTAEISSKLVINATGAWADNLRSDLDLPAKIRPLQGSHLAFSQNALPLPISVSINHPRDGRPVFAFPWEGITLVGTTDIDIHGSIVEEPRISPQEAEYLLEFVQFAFPDLNLTALDVISTWSGIRPVVNTGKKDPSKESREHAIWYEDGLLTITGGKLTTFRVMAQDAMKAAKSYLPARKNKTGDSPILQKLNLKDIDYSEELPIETTCRLLGRYAYLAPINFKDVSKEELSQIESTPYIWKEIEWASSNEGVLHLDDLLLRRVRVGILLQNGGIQIMPRIRQIAQKSLGWDDDRWEQEERDYKQLIETAYSL